MSGKRLARHALLAETAAPAARFGTRWRVTRADFLAERLAAAAVGDEKQCGHVEILPVLRTIHGRSVHMYANCTHRFDMYKFFV
jgi:hypothetical protein